MDIVVFACILLLVIAVLAVCVLAVSSVEPPLEDYRSVVTEEGAITAE